MRALVLPIDSATLDEKYQMPHDVQGLGQYVYVATGTKRIFRVVVLVLVMSNERDAGKHRAEVVARDAEEREMPTYDTDGNPIRVVKEYDLQRDPGVYNVDKMEFWVELRAGSDYGRYELALKMDGAVVWTWPMLVMDTVNLKREKREGRH